MTQELKPLSNNVLKTIWGCLNDKRKDHMKRKNIKPHVIAGLDTALLAIENLIKG